jgi:hypothetical protein
MKKAILPASLVPFDLLFVAAHSGTNYRLFSAIRSPPYLKAKIRIEALATLNIVMLSMDYPCGLINCMMGRTHGV